VRAVVLVGGEGTRLRPLTLTRPKQMLPIAGRRMIERVLAALNHHGVERAVLSLGYRPDAFLAAYPDARAAGVDLEYAVETEPLDTAGAIAFAAREAGICETFVAVNGDVLTALDVSGLVEFHRQRGAEATIALTPVEDSSAFGVVVTDPDGKVVAFVEKPPPGEAPTNLVNAGTYVLEPSVLERIGAGRRVSIEREIFPLLAEEGRLFALASDDYWMDAGTPQLYLQANRDALELPGLRPPLPGARVAAAGVWVVDEPVVKGDVSPCSLVAEEVVVESGARVAGSVLGAGTRVEPGAWVIGSVLLPGVVVGAGTVVEDSILGEEVIVGEEASVRAVSVVGDGVRLEAGTALSGDRVPAPV
jgi:mannose-1-phosphate guanylyltransferase